MLLLLQFLRDTANYSVWNDTAVYIAASNLRMLSSDSRCRMWDADAQGYARGEGVAAVFLKPLSAALEDGDNIEGVIRATGVCVFLLFLKKKKNL